MSEYTYKIGDKKHVVTREVYLVCKQANRKERYFTYDLKVEQFEVCENRVIITPSKEDSYERLLEVGKEFADDAESVEDIVTEKIMLDKLQRCLSQLNEGDMRLLRDIYYEGKSEREVSALTGVHHMTIHSRKRRILSKLREMMEK